MIIIFIFKNFIYGIKFLTTYFFLLIKWFVIGFFTCILIFPYYFCIGIYYLFNKKKRIELGFSKPVIPIFIMILSLATYFISIFIFTRWFVQSQRIKKMSEDIIESTIILEKIEDDIDINSSDISLDNNVINDNNNFDSSYDYSFNVDFNSLLNRNPDTVAWLKVDGTNINYPVVQTNDNEYYLNHDINKYSTNVGWIFGDYRSDFSNFEKNTIIYGHNLTNKTMFGSLPKVLRSSWYKKQENHFITLNTKDAIIIWKVFSIYKIEPVTDYLRTNFYSNEEYNEWLILMKNRSVYNFGEDIDVDDKILTLSTCDDTGDNRVVLQAKMISYKHN